MVFSRGQAQNGNLLKMGGASFFIHLAMVVLFSLNPFPTIIKTQRTPYTVTFMPIPVQEPVIQKPSPPPVVKEEKPKPVVKEEKPKPIEKPKIEKPKKEDIVEKVKKPQKEKVELKHLQEALEEIRKKAAIDEIRERVARREKLEERIAPLAPPAPIVSSSKASVRKESSKESRLNEYYSLIWSKIKEEWTIPENLLREKEMVDIETVIVIIIGRDGKIQKSWFEKKSGYAIYDQSAMRALVKAEPFPPIPKELNEKTLEIGIRFFPD
jgi:colicin import membrane protein